MGRKTTHAFRIDDERINARNWRQIITNNCTEVGLHTTTDDDKYSTTHNTNTIIWGSGEGVSE